MKSVMIVAAEASSSLYAQRLLEYWKAKNIQVNAFGVGSQAMENLGFERFGRAEDMAVVGVVEVIKHFSVIAGVFNRLVEECRIRKPDLVLLMDYPDFNLRLAKKLKKQGLKVAYYISPQMWVWRKSRVKIVQKYVDRMIVLFPFEVEFYRKNGVQVEFVGNPLLDELADQMKEAVRLPRSRYGISENQVVLGLMPGSRHGEIRHHLKVQLECAQILAKNNPELCVLLMVAPTLNLEEIKSELPPLNFSFIVLQQDPLEMIALTDVILCASGTATLMVALMKKPMVIMYKMSPLTVWIGRRIMKKPRFFGLPNLILNRSIVREMFQEEVSPQSLAEAVEPLLKDASLRERVSRELGEVQSALGESGVTGRVSHVLESLMNIQTGP